VERAFWSRRFRTKNRESRRIERSRQNAAPASLEQDKITLNEQIQKMVREGAAIGVMEHHLIIALGVVILEEPARRLFFLEEWGTGTGYGHVLRWETTEQQSNQVRFLVRGKLSFNIAPFDEWWMDPDDLAVYQESFAAWKLELAENRRAYQRFARTELSLLTR